MPRIAIFEKDCTTNGWYGKWEGQTHRIGPYLVLRNCYIDLAAAAQIDITDFDDRSKWSAVMVSQQLCRVTEIEAASATAATPARAPRQARIETLGSVYVGWWLNEPDKKVEGQMLDDAVRALAHLIGQPEYEFHLAVARDRGWKTEFAGSVTTITEILPEPGATPCPDCAFTDHPGKYVGAFSVEDCRTCKGKTTI